MRTDILAAILEPWGIRPGRERIDIAVAGSPERSATRHVVEDAAGGLFLLESLEPATVPRKAEIARALSALSGRLPEVLPYLPTRNGGFIAEGNGRPWRVSRFVAGVPLDRPGYAFEGWRGTVLADVLVRLGAAAREAGPALLPDDGSAFSLPDFIRDLASKLEARRADIASRVRPALDRLEGELFAALPAWPLTFSHGDFHPLNIIWSRDGVRAVIDWEFCGPRPALYDAAVLVGCLGMEEPRSLTGDCVVRLVERLAAGADFPSAAWTGFLDLVLAVRFAWLSDWLRRCDAEMVDLETVYIDLLLENRSALLAAWGLPAG